MTVGVAQEWKVAIPFRTAFDGQSLRRATLLKGPAGWGECSPLPGYPCEPAKARAAAEEAAFSAAPPAVRTRVPVNALVPAMAAGDAAAVAAKAASDGFGSIKVKVGTVDSDDVARVAAIRDAVGPSIGIRVDANGAWDVDSAVAVMSRLAPFDLEFVEQPVATLAESAEVRRRISVRVAADESVRDVDDAVQLRRLGAADVLVVKVQPLGGVAAALRIAEAACVPVVVSSMYETSVGLATGLALAASLPELPFACGLATAGVLAGDVVDDPLVAVGGELEVRRPVPETHLLSRYEDRS